MEENKSIPNLEIDAKSRIIEQTKSVPLLINGVEQKVVLRKMNTGVRNRVRGECSQTKVLNGIPQVTINEAELQEKVLLKVIIEAPFEIDIQTIKQLPPEVADYLYDEYDNFAEPTAKKKD